MEEELKRGSVYCAGDPEVGSMCALYSTSSCNCLSPIVQPAPFLLVTSPDSAGPDDLHGKGAANSCRREHEQSFIHKWKFYPMRGAARY